MPARPIDHLVLGSADLDALAGLFKSLGFQVGSRNRHPWGTENRIIQLADQSFLELITVGEGAEIAPHAPGHFSFGAFVHDGIRRLPGLSMVVLKSTDAQADAAQFTRDGIGGFAPFDFARKAIGPDGQKAEVAFSLAFAADRALANCGFFTCQHHMPQNFWAPDRQTHPNGAFGVRAVTIVAENPSDHHIFLSAFTGSREMRAGSSGISIPCGHGMLEILTRESFRHLYGVEAPPSDGPLFAGFSLAVKDPAEVGKRGAAAGLTCLGVGKAITLAPQPAFSTAIRFEPQGGGA
ncbi:VOC domain containing protein [Rhabdaerophilaceae bacterium]